MIQIQETTPPRGSFLAEYQEIAACSWDCWRADIDADISLSDHINAFFGCKAFFPEAALLRVTQGRWASEDDIANCLSGQSPRLLVWKTESRSGTEIIMQPGNTPIRSWWMVEARENGTTPVYFGSALLPKIGRDGVPRPPVLDRLFGGGHRLYARILLRSTAKKLRAARKLSERPA